MVSTIDNALNQDKEDSVQGQEIKKSDRNRGAKKESQRKVEVKRNHSNNPNYTSSI